MDKTKCYSVKSFAAAAGISKQWLNYLHKAGEGPPRVYLREPDAQGRVRATVRGRPCIPRCSGDLWITARNWRPAEG